jgi:hypothetical protein
MSRGTMQPAKLARVPTIYQNVMRLSCGPEKEGKNEAGDLQAAHIQRRRPDLNRRMEVLQTSALPLGYVAINTKAGDGIRTHDLLLGKQTFYH